MTHPTLPPFPANSSASAAPAASGHGEDDNALALALGLRIRQLRRERGLSCAQLAKAAGLPATALPRMEAGTLAAPLPALQAVAKALGTSLSQLLAQSEHVPDSSYVPLHEAVDINRRGTRAGHHYQALGTIAHRDLVVEPYLITLADDALPFTGFTHVGGEFLYMLEGETHYRHGDKAYALHPGDALMFDAQAPHGPESIGPGTVRYLSIIAYARSP